MEFVFPSKKSNSTNPKLHTVPDQRQRPRRHHTLRKHSAKLNRHSVYAIMQGPQLTCVHLTGFLCITDELLVALVRSAQNLDELDLSHCQELTARGVGPGVWPDLRVLRLDKCKQVEPNWVVETLVETLRNCRLPLIWTADDIHARTGPYLHGAVREEMME
ncbi:hypothetical protein BC937DRAFT_88329 [Endogone sp. FLAS-F59071]|nr:hypothetical protein BC937DRAFT_88329 [Endogone sp. FLAS-F59071]|eukprot:RUS18799.1 hypothetical protein BC937DRAFT_88329 [Endogone sp. FLAS-F59071]